MVSYAREADRWRQEHDKVRCELQGVREVLTCFRAFVRHKGLHEELLEFSLSHILGEEKAREIVARCRANEQDGNA